MFLEKTNYPLFKPLSYLKSGFAQTIAAKYWPVNAVPLPTEIGDVALDDGDILKLVLHKNTEWKNGDRIVVLVHGLAGSSDSKYLQRITQRLYRAGFLTVGMNLRGCGIGEGFAKSPYHSGRSEDLRAVVSKLSEKFGKSPITVVGFSLGGNITLKTVGENTHSTDNWDSFMAVSPPVDLEKTVNHMRSSWNRIFEQYFISLLKKDARKQSKYSDDQTLNLPWRLTLRDFDDIYTAPRSGFRDAQDYYSQSSSAQFIPNISMNGIVLISDDDPIVEAESFRRIQWPKCVEVIHTENGGHVGFLGPGKNKSDYLWMDGLICEWVQSLSQPET